MLPANDELEQMESTARKPAMMSPSVVKKLLELHWARDKTAEGAKINPDAVKLAAEYLRLFIIGESSGQYTTPLPHVSLKAIAQS